MLVPSNSFLRAASYAKVSGFNRSLLFLNKARGEGEEREREREYVDIFFSQKEFWSIFTKIFHCQNKLVYNNYSY